MSNQRQWLKGDTHLHTSNSDGNLTTPELIKRCKKNGLDWAIITDHNFPAADAPYENDNLLILQGEEVTGRPGHFNAYGVQMPVSPPYKLDSFEDRKSVV